MIDINNPAGRYYEILRQAKEKGDNVRVRQVWSQVLGETEENDLGIIRKVIEVFHLGEETKNLIKVSDVANKQLYLSSFDNIEKIFFPLELDVLWSRQRALLSEGIMTRLQFCSDLLSSIYFEEQVEKEDLDQIAIGIEELFSSIQESTLEAGIRMTLLEEVERLRSAIVMYKIKGAKGLKESLQSTIGMLVANQSDLSNAAKTDPSVIESLLKLADKIDSFSAKVLKVKKALTKPVQFLIDLASKDDKESQSRDVEATDEDET